MSRNLFEEYEVCNPDQEREPEYPFLKPSVERCAFRSGQLLDAGCGRGYWFPFYVKWGMKKENLLGVDFSNKAIESLTANGYRGVAASLTDMRMIESNSFDLCVALGSLMATYSTRKSFFECCRVVKPGGELLVNIYNVYHPYFWLIHKVTYPLRVFLGKYYWIWWFPFVLFFHVQNFLRRRKFLNWKDLKAVFFDQVMTPFAHLHSRKEVEKWFQEEGLTVLASGYNLGYSMFWILGQKLNKG